MGPKKKQLAVVAIVGLILTALLFIWFIAPNASSRLQRLGLTPQTSPYIQDFVPSQLKNNNKPSAVKTAPEIMVDRYTLSTPLPKAVGANNLYFLKSFTRDEALTLARKLIGERSMIRELNREILVTDTLGNNQQMIIDPATGMFLYTSKLEQPVFPYLGRGNPAGVVARHLRKLGLIDDSVAATSYYRRSDRPKEIFVEFHRLWVQNIPIINSAGIINSETPLDNLSLTAFDDNYSPDPNIIQSSDGESGKSRNNVFNTLTAVVSDQGHLRTIYSSIPAVERIESLEKLGLRLLEPREIVKELEEKGSYLSYLVPKTTSAWEQLFPNNQAKLTKASITSIALAYLGKPLGVVARYLQPVYVVRGTALLPNGIQTVFTQTVPAIEPGKEVAIPHLVYALEPTPGKSIQIGSFDLTPAPTESPLPTSFILATPATASPPVAVTLLPPPKTCQAKDLQTDITYTPTDQFFVEGIGTLVLFRTAPRISTRTFFLAPVPYILMNAPITTVTDGMEISPPCMIMPTT